MKLPKNYLSTEADLIQCELPDKHSVKILFTKAVDYFFFFLFSYLPYLSSIHEKANCTAIFWKGSPHSLGRCHFRGVWATCLPHKGGGVPLSALPKHTTSELAGLFSPTSPKWRAPSREAVNTTF